VPNTSHALYPHNESVRFSNGPLAGHLGTTVETLHSWATTIYGFPRPRLIARRPYFLRDEIMDWLRQQPMQGRAADAARA
jgi:hypothetical protein